MLDEINHLFTIAIFVFVLKLIVNYNKKVVALA